MNRWARRTGNVAGGRVRIDVQAGQFDQTLGFTATCNSDFS